MKTPENGPESGVQAEEGLATPSGFANNLWQHNDFLKLWSAQAISAFGSRITRTALPIVAILTIQASPAEVSILGAIAVVPGVLVGLFMGGFIDRSPKRRLLIAADLVRALILFTVPVAAWFGWLDMLQLCAVAAIVGAASALFQIADNAYLPALLGKGNLIEANSKLEATEAIAEIGGPSIAGFLVGLLTAPVAIAFDAVSYLVSAALLSAIRSEEHPIAAETAPPTLLSDLRAGIRAGYGHPLLRPIFLAAAIGALSNGFFLALYMLFTIETLGLSPELVGMLIGVGGIGAFSGALIARPAAEKLGLGPAMILLLALAQAAALCIPLAQGPHWLVVTLLFIHQLAGDGFMVAYFIHAVSLRQTLLPINVQARANATLHIQMGILLPLGALIAGPMAEMLDVRTALWFGVIGGLLAPAVLAVSKIRRLREMPQPG